MANGNVDVLFGVVKCTLEPANLICCVTAPGKRASGRSLAIQLREN